MSIGIIGGADGPTSIFISSPVFWLVIAGAGMALIAGFILYYCRHIR